jgi:hypothetical protein
VVQANVRTLEAVQESFTALGVAFQNDGESAGVTKALRAAPGDALGALAALRAPHVQRLIYVSAAASKSRDRNARDLQDILDASVRRNASLHVTGALLFCGEFYVQVLEGEAAAVRAVFASITRDHRHFDIRVLQDEPVRHRRFGDWSMCAGLLAPEDPMVLDYPEMGSGFRAEALTVGSAAMLLSLVQGGHPRLKVSGGRN